MALDPELLYTGLMALDDPPPADRRQAAERFADVLVDYAKDMSLLDVDGEEDVEVRREAALEGRQAFIDAFLPVIETSDSFDAFFDGLAEAMTAYWDVVAANHLKPDYSPGAGAIGDLADIVSDLEGNSFSTKEPPRRILADGIHEWTTSITALLMTEEPPVPTLFS